MKTDIDPGDKIELKGMVFYGFHGNNPEEKELGQRFIVDIEIFLDLSPAGISDNLSHTISYASLYRVVKKEVEGPSRNLLEAVAETIASAILDQFEIHKVNVRILKPEAPIKGSVLDYAGVEITRGRD